MSYQYRTMNQSLLLISTCLIPSLLVGTPSRVNKYDISQAMSIPVDNEEYVYTKSKLLSFAHMHFNSKKDPIINPHLQDPPKPRTSPFYIGLINDYKFIIKDEGKIKMMDIHRSKDKKVIEPIVQLHPASDTTSDSVIIRNKYKEALYIAQKQLFKIDLNNQKFIKELAIDWNLIANEADRLIHPDFFDKTENSQELHDDTIYSIEPIKTTIASADRGLFIATTAKNDTDQYLLLICLDGLEDHQLDWAKKLKLNALISPDQNPNKASRLETPEIALSQENTYLLYDRHIFIINQFTGETIFHHFFNNEEAPLKGIVVNREGHIFTQGELIISMESHPILLLPSTNTRVAMTAYQTMTA